MCCSECGAEEPDGLDSNFWPECGQEAYQEESWPSIEGLDPSEYTMLPPWEKEQFLREHGSILSDDERQRREDEFEEEVAWMSHVMGDWE